MKLRKKEIDQEIIKQLKEKVNFHKKNIISYTQREIRKQVSEKNYEEQALKKVNKNPALAKQAGYRAETWQNLPLIYILNDI